MALLQVKFLDKFIFSYMVLTGYLATLMHQQQVSPHSHMTKHKLRNTPVPARLHTPSYLSVKYLFACSFSFHLFVCVFVFLLKNDFHSYQLAKKFLTIECVNLWFFTCFYFLCCCSLKIGALKKLQIFAVLPRFWLTRRRWHWANKKPFGLRCFFGTADKLIWTYSLFTRHSALARHLEVYLP